MTEVISMNDMTNGQGEWKNLQEIIRKTFKACFTDLKQHDEEISHLQENIHVLKEELNKRPTWDDLDKMIQLKMIPYKQNVAVEENDVQQQLLQMKTEMEKKVSMNYLEKSLAKKMDRSDVLVREISRFSLKDYQDDIKKIKLDLIHMQSQLDECNETIEKQQFQTNICSSKYDQIGILQAVVESIQKTVSDCPLKEEVHTALASKVSQVDLDVVLTKVADKREVDYTLEKIQKSLQLHEQLLTSLRISCNDPSLFTSNFKSPPINVSSSSSHSERSKESDMLIPGMESTVIPVLWGKMDVLHKDNKKLRKQLTSFEESLSTVREAVSKAANVDKVELLGIILEEQLQRIDGIIQGTTKIKPIQSELHRLGNAMEEVHEYLKLPQSEPLHKQLSSLASACQELDGKVLEMDTAIQQHIVSDLQLLHEKCNSIESRWASYLHDRDQIISMKERTDLSGTPYKSLRHLTEGLEQLRKLVDQSSTAAADILPGQSHNIRLNKLELSAQSSSHEIDKLKHKLRQVKQVLVTLSLEAPVVTVAKSPAHSETSSPSLQSSRSSSLGESKGNSSPPGFSPIRSRSPQRPSLKVQSPIKSYRERLNTAASVDFEQVLAQVFSKGDMMNSPVPMVTDEKSSVTIAEVDERLAALEKEKKRLRKLLVTSMS